MAISWTYLLIFQFLVAVVKKLFPDFQFTWLVEEIKRNLPLELDFCNEGKNCEMLGRMVGKFPYLKVSMSITLKFCRKSCAI